MRQWKSITSSLPYTAQRSYATNERKTRDFASVLRQRAKEHDLPSNSDNAITRLSVGSDAVLSLLSQTTNLLDPKRKVSRRKRSLKRAQEKEKTEAEKIMASATEHFAPSFLPLYDEPNIKNTRATQSSWVGDNWQENWGTDKLRSPTYEAIEKLQALADEEPTAEDINPLETEEELPPHIPPSHVPPPHVHKKKQKMTYSRRVEGLLEASDVDPLQDVKPPSEQQEIAVLEHGLDRVLFNPGVHWMQDPHSRVYNFNPWLEKIPKVGEFDFDRLPGFVKSSRDEDLSTLAKLEKVKYGGSTSSLSGMLSQIYFLISGDRDVDTSMLSRHFASMPTTFTPGQRMPSSVIFNYNAGVYTIDTWKVDAQESDTNILTWMGTLLEKFLTSSKDEFNKHLRSAPPLENPDTRKPAYRYSKSQKFVMRSQLDCYDPRLPGTGVFDLKTRAALPVRLDIMNHEANSGYLIRQQIGMLESFEREYYDLIRSAFLKYSFQVRIGNMDGVMVAYHNTKRIFGFQYISLEEMDQALFGAPGRGTRVFNKCVSLLEVLADEVTACFPHESIICMFETLEGTNAMQIWVEPENWDYANGHKPVRQLEVTVNSYLGEDEVRPTRAVTNTEEPWTLHWTIKVHNHGDEETRLQLDAARKRQIFALNLPEGVTLEGMEDIWKTLNYTGPPLTPADERIFKADNFRNAPRSVQILRDVAKNGRERTVQEAREMQGKPKIIWNQPDEVYEMLEEPQAVQGTPVKKSALHESPEALEALEGFIEKDLKSKKILTKSQSKKKRFSKTHGGTGTRFAGTTIRHQPPR